MGLFSKKTPSLPETIPLGSWAMVQGSNQGSLLLARVRKGLGSVVGHVAYPYRVGERDLARGGGAPRSRAGG